MMKNIITILSIVLVLCIITFHKSIGCDLAPDSGQRYGRQMMNELLVDEETMKVDNEEDLSLLFILHRHGDRSPVSFAPKDQYREESDKIWPMGPGMLTNEGKDRMYKLGQYLRRRYATFLTNNPREVHSVSSDADRCIESAQVVLAGLYKPQDGWVWNDKLQWLPMAVHTIPQEDDAMLNAFSYCPKRKSELNVALHSDTIKKNLQECNKGRDITSRLIEEYGYNFRTPFTYSKAYITLLLQKDKKLPLKSWLEKDFQDLACLAIETQYIWTHTEKLKRLYSGVLINDIIEKMHQKQLKDEKTNINANVETKLYHYSTHDTNIHALLNTLGVYRDQLGGLPEFGSTIIFELYRAKSSEAYKVKILYLNKTEEEEKSIKELKLFDCLKDGAEVCTLDGFDRVTKRYQLKMKDWYKECEREKL